MFPKNPSRQVAAFLFVALLPALAWSQESLDEIVVTADFRGRTTSELPASVTVLDAERIRESAVQHFEELIFAVPNLNWSGDGNRARYLQIRGVGELEQYEGAPNPSVGFLVDDIDFSGIGTIATLFDVQQIDVLRGPQGTRYGANALGGLVYVQSQDPTDEWDARVQLSAGGDDLLSGGIALGGPISEGSNVRYRLSAHHHESDGFRNNPFMGRDDTNGRSETTLRAKLAWGNTDDWSFKATAMFVDIDDGYDAFALDNGLTVLSDNPGRDAQQSLGLALRAERSLGADMTFTSITSVADSDIDFSFDADWGNTESWDPFVYDYTSATSRQRETFSQEFRLSGNTGSGINWLGGVYALALDEQLATRNLGVYEDLVVFDFVDSLDQSLASSFDSLNLAVFGQVGFPVGDRGEFSVGLRLEDRTTDYDDSDGLSASPDDFLIGGELAYRHAFSDRMTAYASLSRGYKAGGFNLGFVPDAQRDFVDEALWSAEVGVKSVWLDGQLGLDAAVFYNRRDDQQVRGSVQLNPNDPASFVFFTDNVARGTALGFEADIRWAPTEGLEFYAGIGLLDTEFDRTNAETASLDGRAQAHAPEYSLSVGGAYRLQSGWFARIDATARDDFFFDVSHDQKSEAYELVNLRLGYEQERWSAQLWARNLFDEDYAVRGFFFPNEPPDFFPSVLYLRRGDPRQIGVTVDYNF